MSAEVIFENLRRPIIKLQIPQNDHNLTNSVYITDVENPILIINTYNMNTAQCYNLQT